MAGTSSPDDDELDPLVLESESLLDESSSLEAERLDLVALLRKGKSFGGCSVAATFVLLATAGAGGSVVSSSLSEPDDELLLEPDDELLLESEPLELVALVDRTTTGFAAFWTVSFFGGAVVDLLPDGFSSELVFDEETFVDGVELGALVLVSGAADGLPRPLLMCSAAFLAACLCGT